MIRVWGHRGLRRKALALGVFMAAYAGIAQAEPEGAGAPPAASGVYDSAPESSDDAARGNDFGASAAADSHNAEDLDIMRRHALEPPRNATLGAADTQVPAENYSAPLPKITPPAGRQPTALRLFRLIPPTIFENTVEGLDENGKQELADNGKSGPWVLTRLADDDLEVTSSVPHSNTKVRVHLYHSAGGDIFIACGVQSGDSCAMELWRRDAVGHIIPMPIPDEPLISEFLAKGRVMPADYEVSMLICLDIDDTRLKAIPLLWTPTGLGNMSLDYDVYYRWNGEAFAKESIPHVP